MQSAEGSNGPMLIKEESLWFLDATLVLQAENRLFRVFPGILGAKSPVFQDMLAFPQPENGEMFDGCPLVRVSDSAVDMTFFLKAIFHYDFFEAWPTRAEFPIVAGILRLSQKYQVDPLRKRALVHLSERCAMTLQKWEESDEWESEVNPIILLNLAREVSADWILPSVLAACCWLEPDELVYGLPPSPGLTARITLTPADIVLCMRGAVKLHTTWTSKLYDFLWVPQETSGCVEAPECFVKRVETRRAVEQCRSEKILPLYLWNDDDWQSLWAGVCTPCFHFMQKLYVESREEYWQALPEIFGLPAWATLEAMRDAALGGN
ncbi:hypothetical protein B0H16DRAFT_1538427 [Mycena metata]|uniref:BTB domain-containing protein n=1 Tax=Mycena metata TaxID=1033252 RepID=A0AAD7NE73_9AGAR|nr:hypothetical protein B0H16DRAFT_1538427 [Mycena metata]